VRGANGAAEGAVLSPAAMCVDVENEYPKACFLALSIRVDVFRVAHSFAAVLPCALATRSAASTGTRGVVEECEVFREAGAEEGRARKVSRRIRECAVAPTAAIRTRSSKPPSLEPSFFPPTPDDGGPNTIAGLAAASRAVATRFVSTAPGRIGVSRSFRGTALTDLASIIATPAPRAAGREVSGRPVALAAPTTLRTLVGDGVNVAAEAGRLAALIAARRLSSMLVSPPGPRFGVSAFGFGSPPSRDSGE